METGGEVDTTLLRGCGIDYVVLVLLSSWECGWNEDIKVLNMYFEDGEPSEKVD